MDWNTKHIIYLILAIILLCIGIFSAGYFVHSCSGPGNHEYERGNSNTNYKPSQELDEFIKEADAAINIYNNYIKRRDAAKTEPE